MLHIARMNFLRRWKPIVQGTSTAQHSTAQHSTAQHSTAQHSTAQHSTAYIPIRCAVKVNMSQLLLAIGFFVCRKIFNGGSTLVCHSGNLLSGI